jgi:hypothetical protein
LIFSTARRARSSPPFHSHSFKVSWEALKNAGQFVTLP